MSISAQELASAVSKAFGADAPLDPTEVKMIGEYFYNRY